MKHTGLWITPVASVLLFAACGNKEVDAGQVVTGQAAVPTATANDASATDPAAAGTTTAGEDATASSSVPPSDPDNPIPLPALQFKGAGTGKAESRYYAFDAGAGTIVVTATAKNSPSGATQALGFALYDRAANRLCFDSHGNTTDDKTVVLKCQIDKPQPLLLRLDLSPESLDHAIALAGPVTLPAAQAVAAASTVAGAGSTDIDEPTRLSGNRIKADGIGKPVSYYYAFNAGPGELTLTGDGSNTSAAMTEALRLGLYTLRSERLCELALGNTTLDKRAVTTCQVDKRQPVILRADLSAETVAFRARFDGPLRLRGIHAAAGDHHRAGFVGAVRHRQGRAQAGSARHVARSRRAREKVRRRRGAGIGPHRRRRLRRQQPGAVGTPRRRGQGLLRRHRGHRRRHAGHQGLRQHAAGGRQRQRRRTRAQPARGRGDHARKSEHAPRRRHSSLGVVAARITTSRQTVRTGLRRASFPRSLPWQLSSQSSSAAGFRGTFLRRLPTRPASRSSSLA